MRKLMLLLVLIAVPASGQDSGSICGLDETYGDCINRLISEATGAAVEGAGNAVAATASAEIADKAAPEAAPDTANSFRDFLPLFFGSLGLGGAEEEDGSLTLTFNPELLDLGPHNPISLQSVLRDPVLFEAMVEAIPESIRAARKSALEEELGDFDDVELSLSWSREDRRWGRSAAEHLDVLGGVFGELHEEAVGTTGTLATQALANALAPGALPHPPESVFSSTPRQAHPEFRAAFEPRLAPSAQEIIRRQDTLVALAAKERFFDLGDLVNNQPQLVASAVYRHRDDRIGPDELAAKVSFEIGFANVNGLRSHCGGEVGRSCLQSYLAKYGDTLEGSPRLTFSAEYAETHEYDFALPADSFTFHLDSVSKTTAQVTYGRYFTANGKGTQERRLDVEAKYEDVSGDPQRQARFVALATITQKMTGDTSASFSVVYASKPEYLGEVDEELSARLGLKYKIDRGGK